MTDDADVVHAIAEWRREEMEHLKPAPFRASLISAARDRLISLRKDVKGEDGTIYSCVLDEIDSIQTSLEDITDCRMEKIVGMAVAEARRGKTNIFSKDTWTQQDEKLCNVVREALTEYLNAMKEGCCCHEQN